MYLSPTPEDDYEQLFMQHYGWMYSYRPKDGQVDCGYSSSEGELYLMICQQCGAKNDWWCHCLPVGACYRCGSTDWKGTKDLSLRSPIPAVFLRNFPEGEEWAVYDDEDKQHDQGRSPSKVQEPASGQEAVHGDLLQGSE